jgi:hypothetical protein
MKIIPLSLIRLFPIGTTGEKIEVLVGRSPSPSRFAKMYVRTDIELFEEWPMGHMLRRQLHLV